MPRTAASCARTIDPISSSAPACMPTALIRSRSMYSVPHLKNGIFSISDDVPMALCYDPRQVITLAGKRYLSGAVVFVRYDTNGSFVALTTSDLYLIQCYLAENSVPLMAGREKI